MRLPILLAVLLALGCSSRDPAKEVSILVVDADGKPVAGAEVVVKRGREWSDDGQILRWKEPLALISSRTGGRGVVVVELPEGAPCVLRAESGKKLSPLLFLRGWDPRHELRLVVGDPRILSGRVTEPSGVPVADAEILVAEGQWYTDAHGFVTRIARSAADGSFTLTGLPGESHHLIARKPGHASVDGDVDPRGGPVQVTLPRGVVLEGAVRGPGGSVSGARVWREEHWFEHEEARTDDTGRFRLADFPPDRPVTVHVDGGAFGREELHSVQWAPGGELRIDLPETRVLSGRVLVLTADGDLEPAAGIAFERRTRRGTGVGKSLFKSDKNGRFRLSGVDLCPQDIDVRDERYTMATASWYDDWFSAEPGPNDIDILLARKGAVSGVVLDARGEPVAGAEVSAGFLQEFIDGKTNELGCSGYLNGPVVRTDSEGRFRLPSVNHWQNLSSVHARMGKADEGSVVVQGRSGENLTGIEVRLGKGPPADRWPGDRPEPEPLWGPPEPDRLQIVPYEYESDDPLIEGRVVNEEGIGVPRAWIEVGGGSTGPPWRFADLVGRFRIPCREHSPVRVWARLGNRFSEITEHVAPGTEDLVLVIRPGATIAGSVRDESGEPLPGMRIYVTPDPGEGSSDPHWSSPETTSGLSDQSGRFVVDGVSRRPLAIHADSNSAARFLAGKRNVAPGTRNLELTAKPDHFESPFIISGRVVNDQGAAIEDFQVTGRPLGFRARDSGKAVTWGEGRFCLWGVAPGMWRLAVTDSQGKVLAEVDALCGRKQLEITVPSGS